MLVSTLGWVISAILLVIVCLLIRIPYVLQDKIKDDRNNKSNHDLQIESYFKELGGKKQESVLKDWVDLFFNMEDPENYADDEKNDSNRLYRVKKNTLIYGSDKSVRLLMLFSKNAIEYSEISMKIKSSEDENTKENVKIRNYLNYKSLVYLAYIISSLKFDFSGYENNPLELLQIQINDYSQDEKMYKNISTEIENELKNI